MKARIFFWSVFLLLQVVSLRFLSAADMSPADLRAVADSHTRPASSALSTGPSLCGSFLPALIADIKTEQPAVAKALQTLYGASVQMSKGNGKRKLAPVEVTKEIKQAYIVIENWFKNAKAADLERYLELGRKDALATIQSVANSIEQARLNKSELPLIAEAQNAIITKAEAELKVWTEFTASEEWAALKAPQEGDSENAVVNRAMTGLSALLETHAADISDVTKAALAASQVENSPKGPEALSASLSEVINLRMAQLTAEKNTASLQVAAMNNGPNNLDDVIARLNNERDELIMASRTELFLLALSELHIREGYESIQSEIRKQAQIQEQRSGRAKAIQQEEAEANKQKTDAETLLQSRLTEQLFSFLDRTLDHRKFPSDKQAAIYNFMGAASLGDASFQEAAQDPNFSLAIFELAARAAKDGWIKSGFDRALILQVLPVWLYAGAKTTPELDKLTKYVAKVAFSRSFAFISNRVLEFEDDAATIQKEIETKKKSKTMDRARLWKRVVLFVMSIQKNKAPVNFMGSTPNNSPAGLSKAERALLKEVYLDLKKYQRNKLKVRDGKLASAVLVDWMLFHGNEARGDREQSISTLWTQTETGFRNRTRRTIAFGWRWFGKPVLVATLLTAAVTGAVTEGLNLANNEGVNWAPDRETSWENIGAVVTSTTDWADETYGNYVPWLGIAGDRSAVYFDQARTWVEQTANEVLP